MRACLLILALVPLALAEEPSTPLPAVDMAGVALDAFTEVTKQITQMQSVLSQLNGQMSKMIVMSTRLVSVPSQRAAAAGAESNTEEVRQIPGAGGLAGSFFETIQRLTGQLSVIQNTMQQMTGQLQRVVETSTRMITGPALLHYQGQVAAESANNVVESILKTFQSWAGQLEQMNGVLRGMNQQWGRVIQTGSKMITGSGLLYQGEASASTAAPAAAASGLPSIPGLPAGVPGLEQLQSFFSLLTGQFAAAQKVLTDFSSQLTRMVTLGAIRPYFAEGEATASPSAVSPGESVLTVIGTLTQQFQQIQKVLAELNQQMNKMVQTGSKALG